MSSWANPCSWEPKDSPWGRERSEHVLRPTCAVQTNSPWLSQAIGTREHIFRQEESSAEMLVWGPSLPRPACSLLHECKLTVKKNISMIILWIAVKLYCVLACIIIIRHHVLNLHLKCLAFVFFIVDCIAFISPWISSDRCVIYRKG